MLQIQDIVYRIAGRPLFDRASATLAKMKPNTPTDKVKRAIKQFGQANNILTNILRRIKTLDEKLALDVSQQLGLNYRTVSKAWRSWPA